MEDEMMEWLLDCYREGSFTRKEAEKIINSDKYPLAHCWQIHDEAKRLFDEFVELFDFEKVETTESACQMFIKELDRREKIEKDKKTKLENDQYYNLI